MRKSYFSSSSRRILTIVALLLSSACFPVMAHEGMKGMSGMSVDKWKGPDYERITHDYRVPDATLEDRHGHTVQLRTLLDQNRPVVLQFIFTTCTTICPVLTAMLSQAQDQLRSLDSDTLLVSISINPDYDTPKRMARYADEFGARGDWRFLTGQHSQVQKAMNAFHAVYKGSNKKYHRPYTYMRDRDSGTWIRLTGLMGAKRLVSEYHRVVEQQSE